MMRTPELEAVYRATTYRVFLPEGVADLRIDQFSSALSCWLQAAGARDFALITACNPRSGLLDKAENERRTMLLEQAVRRLAPLVLRPALNLPDSEDGPQEAGFIFAGLPASQVEGLGKAFGQNALLAGTVDATPRLIWLTYP